MVHLIHTTPAEHHPLLWVWVDRIVGGVIEYRGELQHRSLGQDRLGLIGVDIGYLPIVVVPIYLTQHFFAAIRIDRLHGHDPATHMHMRPITVNDGRRIQHMGALQYLIAVWWNDNVLASCHAVQTINAKHRLACSLQFRSFTVRVKPQTYLDDVT